MRRFLLLVVMLLSGCGGASPAAPTSTPGAGLPFQATRYLFRLVGDPARCTTEAFLPVALASIIVILTPDAAGWTARPDNPANGSLALILRPGTLPVTPPRLSVAGTAQGFMDEGGTLPLPGAARAVLGSTPDAVVPISGMMPLGPITAAGPVDGTVVFTFLNSTTTCPTGATLWSLTPLTTS
jgi:hypothetical protein